MNSINSQNEALVFVGPGFSEQNALIRNLETLNLRVRTSFLPTLQQVNETAKVARGAQLIIFRAPYWISPEELLYIEVMSARLKALFDQIKTLGGFHSHQKILGIGRGAFFMMRNFLSDPSEWNQLGFSKTFTVDHPWINVEQKDLALKLNAFVFSPLVPEWNENQLTDWKPWLWSQSNTIGWRTESFGAQMFASFPDLLAFSTRKQLLDYGYEDLSHLPTQTDILQRIIQGAI